MGFGRSRTFVGSFGVLLVTCLAAGAPPEAAAQDRVEPYHMLLAGTKQRKDRISAQTALIPYFGKNQVRYDKFDWKIYTTEHFEIFFYPELEPHLERITGYAESAYQHISTDLKHDLASRVPLVLFKTQSAFQTQNIVGELPEGVLAFAEPERNRMVLPVDEPPDQLYRLITHELTHIFEFDIIPRGIIGAGLPLWVDEGLANYMAGYWNVLDLMQVRDAALTDNVPRMSRFDAQPLSGRLPYSMGHAAFEFIEARWGKEGLRQFLFSLRKNVLGSGETAFEEALKLSPDDFDDQFDRYIKERFKPFRDKERPADYGRDLSPSEERTPFVSVQTIEPAPSGDMMAVVVGNSRDLEFDVVIISAQDGEIISNLTNGFDQDRGFEYISMAGGLRGNLVPWIAWAPVGDRIAYFGRTEKDKTLVIQNIVSGRTEKRYQLRTVDGPESPAFSPDGKTVAFAALVEGISDIFAIDVETGALTNLTKDTAANYAPTYSPDGRTLVYTARVGGNDKLYKLDLVSRAKTQLTFGSHDDTSAKFADDETLVFTSTATDPSVPTPIEVVRNGAVPNIWTLNLKNGELQQLTDTATGIVSPVVLHGSGGLRVAFVNYYKGQNTIHAISAGRPVATVASADFGTPGPVFDFTVPISHTLIPDNIHKKGAFEKMSLAGRPPVALGVTNSGNFYGNTEITFTDVLGDKQISFYAQSVAQYRTTALSYVNRGRRIHYALQGFAQDQFFYGQALENSGALYDPSLQPFITRDLAEAVQTTRGGTVFAIYPFNRYARLELTTGYMYLDEHYTNATLQAEADRFQRENFGTPIFRTGHMIPIGAALVSETTIFREYGPVDGSTFRLGYDGSPSLGNSGFLSRHTFDIDARYYKRLVANGVFAVRFRGMKSIGQNPDFFRFGGNSEMRGYEYLQFVGHKGFFSNVELRFPLIEAMLTPIGVLGGLRGVIFGNIGAIGFNNEDFNFMDSGTAEINPLLGYDTDLAGNVTPRYGDPVRVGGLRLANGRASYGFGLESSLLGFPMHLDWSWRTMMNRTFEDMVFSLEGGSGAFRQVQFDFWIGYDW